MTNYGGLNGAVQRGEMLGLVIEMPNVERCANCNGVRFVAAWEPIPGIRRKVSATAEGDRYFAADDFPTGAPRWFAGAGWYAGKIQLDHCPVCAGGGR